MKTIPIFFTFDKNYVLAAKVAIHSLIANASKEYKYELYVLHTSLIHPYQRITAITLSR